MERLEAKKCKIIYNKIRFFPKTIKAKQLLNTPFFYKKSFHYHPNRTVKDLKGCPQ